MVNKIINFSDIAMEISENQYAQTLLMSQLRSNLFVFCNSGINKPFPKIVPMVKLDNLLLLAPLDSKPQRGL